MHWENCSSYVNAAVDFGWIWFQGKDHLSASEKSAEGVPPQTGIPDMSEILKGLTNVKLKSIQR